MMVQTEEDPAQAWCEACQAVIDEDRGWSDRASDFADWKLICGRCFTSIVNKHRLEAVFED